jgi:hypothetical protein
MIGKFQALQVERPCACAAYPPVYMHDAGIPHNAASAERVPSQPGCRMIPS